MKVLVVEDDPSVSYFLREVISTAGHEAATAADGLEGLNLFDSFAPDLVFSDLKMPGMDGLELLARIRRMSRETVFVMMTGFGSEELAIRALELKANNYLQKPIRFEVINSLLQKYEAILRAGRARMEAGRMISRLDLRMAIPSRLDHVMIVVDLLVQEASPWLSENERFGVQLGLYELVTNAIEHGNLEIGFEEKSSALEVGTNRYAELVRRKMQQSALATRMATIEFRQNPERLEWVIQDEGSGFNWNQLPNPLSIDFQERLSGRGIFLARFQFDELTFHGNGNKVKAVKFLPPLSDDTSQRPR